MLLPVAKKLFVNRSSGPIGMLSVRNRFDLIKKRLEAGEKLNGPDDWTYNEIERKESLKKPIHTLEEQMEYMKSDEFAEVYKGRPIYLTWRRNIKGQWKVQPPPRKFCIDRNGRFNVNHACPVCRDEYLFFDYRNPALIEHFIYPGTDQPLPIHQAGLCIEQYMLLRVHLLKAKENGTITFNVPFRHFDYAEWYPRARDERGTPPIGAVDPSELPSRSQDTVDELYPNAEVDFDVHNREFNTHWDEWWVRHDKFAKKGR